MRTIVGNERTLLVGTRQGVAHLRCLLATGAPAMRVTGEHIIHPGTIDDMLDALGGALRAGSMDLVLVSMPLAMDECARAIAKRLDESHITWRFMPTLEDQLAGRAMTGLRPAGVMAAIDPTTLIDRTPHKLDDAAIRAALADRVVLITGAGGSIGSELAQQVCRYRPRRLVLVERSENALFEVDRMIRRLHPRVDVAAQLHDVTDARRTMTLLASHRPHVILHAAAHKHVPMMEDHPADAVENNFYGTRAVADAADAHGVERFVMISTDKAVNPSSVMGASKRLAELYIQYLNGRSDCIYSMVRFGNVLGSACSVMPIWRQQLAHGGPITVTHAEMTRYFMTIPEAAGLVLQSAALSNADGRGGGEVFLLDMGKPVRILDLAERFVLAHGLVPGDDIEIRITGIRPGEKLFEELAYDSEDMIPTAHGGVRIWRTTPPSEERMRRIIVTFDHLRRQGDDDGHRWDRAGRDAILNGLRIAVPEMVTAAAG